ncbi:hypothetical protein C0J52_04594 [Blattella germanica]|nr:hypothetical protein C0J52_04594 [Blattella germanica]
MPTGSSGGGNSKKHKRSGSGKKAHAHHSSSSSQQQSQQQLVATSRHQTQHQQSFSSSDDELRSTPECTSCEEHDSEKGDPAESFGDRLKKQAILDEKIKKFLAVRVISHVKTVGVCYYQY